MLHPDPPAPADREGKPVRYFRERVSSLIGDLSASEQVIGIPAPALAEILVCGGPQRAHLVAMLSNRLRFQILPFDSRGAIEAAELIEKIKSATKEQDRGTWAKIKFDVQIVAIAKAESASVIYADDKGIEAKGRRVGIRVIRVCDLPYATQLATVQSETLRDPRQPGEQLLLIADPEDPRSGLEAAPAAEIDRHESPPAISEEPEATRMLKEPVPE